MREVTDHSLEPPLSAWGHLDRKGETHYVRGELTKMCSQVFCRHRLDGQERRHLAGSSESFSSLGEASAILCLRALGYYIRPRQGRLRC